MIQDNKNQSDNLPIEPSANSDQLTVEYWRNRFRDDLKKFKSLAKLADVIGPLDGDFAGGSGYVRLQNIRAGRAGIQITAKAVRLMEKVGKESDT